MEKQFDKKGRLTGYIVGDIHIHEHIHDPEGWRITIRPLDIFGQSLCKKTCTEDAIARHAHLVLVKKQQEVEKLIKSIIPFTAIQ